MAKKTYVDVLGLKKGKAPEVIATFSNRQLANWHNKNTFEDFGYDNLLLKNSNVKGDKFISDVVAEDKESYIQAIATMEITDMTSVTTVTRRNTLLGYILEGVLKNKTGVKKVELLESDDTNVALEDLQKQVQVVYSDEDVYPLAQIEKKLTKALLDALTDEEESGSEVEEEETKPKKETKKEKEAKKEEKKEEETVEEDIEDDIGEDIEDDSVEDDIDEEDEEESIEEDDSDDEDDIEDELDEDIDEDDSDEDDSDDSDDKEETGSVADNFEESELDFDDEDIEDILD